MESLHETKLYAAVRQLKLGPGQPESSLLVRQQGRAAAWLIPLTRTDAGSAEAVALLASWRRAAAGSFPSQFPVTEAGTQRWLMEQVLEVPDRLLFWVADLDGHRIGHMGLYRFDPAERHIEIDNVVRGVPDVSPGVMQAALVALLDWTFTALEMEAVFLRVFSDNERALRLYSRNGFVEMMRMPLARVIEGETVRWVEVNGSYRQPVSRYFVTMAMQQHQWLAGRKRGYAA